MNNVKQLKRISIRIITSFVFFCLVFANASPCFAQSQAMSNGGLQVSNALWNLSAVAGKAYQDQIVVSSGAQAPAMDITVEARGFGESLSGAFLPLTADQDTSPYSARSWITAIDHTSFHLEPGGQQAINITLNTPQTLGTDTHYAMIYIHSQPVSAGNGVGQVIAASIPVVVTPQDVKNNLAGTITDFTVSAVTSGTPIEIAATVKNTGNRHYKVSGSVVISDASGKQVADLPIAQTGTSIIPTYSQQLDVSYSALDQARGLDAGTYTVQVTVLRDDGTQLATQKTTFTVAQSYQPFPGIDSSHLLIVNFKNQEPGTIDARTQADVELTFEGTGKVTGQVAIGKYTKEPADTPAFAAAVADGGMGLTGMKFIAIQVSGFSQGTAHLKVHYTNAELNSIDANSLLLAYNDGQVWHRLNNLSVQTGAQVVLGDVNVSVLTKGMLIALGGQGNSTQSVASPSSWLTRNWPYGLAALAVLIALGLVGVLLLDRKKSKSGRNR